MLQGCSSRLGVFTSCSSGLSCLALGKAAEFSDVVRLTGAWSQEGQQRGTTRRCVRFSCARLGVFALASSANLVCVVEGVGFDFLGLVLVSLPR